MKGLIPPWYRSRLFWLGVPGLMFLLWAWGDSNRNRRTAWFHSDYLISAQGKVFWHRLELENQTGVAADWLITKKSYKAQVDLREGDVSVVSESLLSEPNAFQVIRVTTRSGLHTERVISSERRWFPPLRWRWVQLDATARYRFISLPFWLLTTGYIVVWATAVVIWKRRRARKLKHSDPLLEAHLAAESSFQSR